MIITTCDIQDKKYEVVKVVFASAISGVGMMKTANPMEAYTKVHDDLAKIATEAGADAVVGVRFEYRTAAASGCLGAKPVFQVFAYGTSVKFIN